MKVPFEIEWLGGAAEHHFRKARPGADDLPWGTVNRADYAPEAVEAARRSWTEMAINEYRAVTSFCEVLRALADAKAPLDLLGMTSDFLADECAHVELASRMAMELGGAVARTVDIERFSPRPTRLTAFQRANDLVLRVSCVSEAITGGTATVTMSGIAHPLPRAIYESVLRDEAHHRRLGGLYFEWALARIDDDERRRMSAVLLGVLRSFSFLWKPRAAADPSSAQSSSAAQSLEDGESFADDLHALGWLVPARFARVAREVVVRDVLDPLATIGIEVSGADREELLAAG